MQKFLTTKSLQKGNKTIVTVPSSSSTKTETVGGWVCNSCTFQNATGLNVCEMCGLNSSKSDSSAFTGNGTQSAEFEQQDVTCPQCTFMNPAHPQVCDMCGYNFPKRECESVLQTSLVKTLPRVTPSGGGDPSRISLKAAGTSRIITFDNQSHVPSLKNNDGIQRPQTLSNTSRLDGGVTTKQDEFCDLELEGHRSSRSYILKIDPKQTFSKRRLVVSDLSVPQLRSVQNKTYDAIDDQVDNSNRIPKRNEEFESISSDEELILMSDEEDHGMGDDHDSVDIYSISDDELSDVIEDNYSSEVEFLPDAKYEQRQKKIYSLIRPDEEEVQQFEDDDSIVNVETLAGPFLYKPLARVKEIPPSFPKFSQHFWSIQQLSKYKCCSVDFNLFTLDGGATNPNCPITVSRSIKPIDHSNIGSAYDKRKRLREAKLERAKQRKRDKQEKHRQKSSERQEKAMEKHSQQRQKSIARKHSQRFAYYRRKTGANKTESTPKAKIHSKISVKNEK